MTTGIPQAPPDGTLRHPPGVGAAAVARGTSIGLGAALTADGALLAVLAVVTAPALPLLLLEIALAIAVAAPGVLMAKAGVGAAAR